MVYGYGYFVELDYSRLETFLYCQFNQIKIRSEMCSGQVLYVIRIFYFMLYEMLFSRFHS